MKKVKYIIKYATPCLNWNAFPYEFDDILKAREIENQIERKGFFTKIIEKA